MSETEEEKLERNWNDLLQELRVTQTGVQILTGFLLTVPFSNRFTDLDNLQRTVYLVVMAGALITTGFVVAPVAFHRILFRKHRRPWLVAAANQCARIGLLMLALTSSGVFFLVFDVVIGTTSGLIAFVASLLFFAGTWLAIPWLDGRRDH